MKSLSLAPGLQASPPLTSSRRDHDLTVYEAD